VVDDLRLFAAEAVKTENVAELGEGGVGHAARVTRGPSVVGG
jgi:hypothetical protein